MSRNRSRAVATALVGAAALAAPLAHAQQKPLCSSLNLPHPIFGAGGSAITNDLKGVGAALSTLASPVTLLFSDPSACTGFTGFLNKKVTGDFKYWTVDPNDATKILENGCSPDPVLGQEVDFAHMGNTADFCPNTTLPADVGDFTGPIQTVNIITGAGSNEASISAEALYFIYGFGADGKVPPWANPTHTVQRTASSFVQLFVAAAIGVPPAAFKGTVSETTNQAVADDVTNLSSGNGQDAIGFVSGSTADATKGVKTLAFQAKGQSCGFWPDSTATARDKANVRSGQYFLWTPGHFFAVVDSKKKIVNADVANLVGWFNGTIDAPDGLDVAALTIKAGDIPQCAMQVTRDGTAGAISSFAPPVPCTHYFEKNATGTTTGTVCSADKDCKSKSEPKCRLFPSNATSGYCEAY
ncbi:MAG TPA: hypothetical protein VH062_06885 [Polyangiaceae bacterium]|jgi:hypothetical protein|nr:hypothetical protein [Polyangiaceae bacterium]